jgi:RecB family exonuclease
VNPGPSQPAAAPGFLVRVFPSGAALNQQLNRDLSESSHGVLLRPQYYTFENLLPAILADLPLLPGQNPLEPMAGPLLVQDLISKYRESEGILSGVARGHRLPDRLWRLLVEIKAAGLDPESIRQISDSSNLHSLADLLEQYNQHLKRLGLQDQADLLGRAEELIQSGGVLPIMANWAALEANGVLWLRSLDLRMLKLISRLIPVTVRFYITPQKDEPLYMLCQVTASYLEASAPGTGRGGNLNIEWDQIAHENGEIADQPLAGLAQKLLRQPGGGYGQADAYPLELVRSAGRYSEVEHLVHRAHDLVAKGVAPEDIALIFPDLSLYGQMVADVASRVGLPLERQPGLKLSSSPLVTALLSLLDLGRGDMPAAQVSRVFDSPYLKACLAPWLLGSGAEPIENSAGLLALAGYVDGREGGLADKLHLAALRHPKVAEPLTNLGHSLARLRSKLSISRPNSTLISILQSIYNIITEVNPQPGNLSIRQNNRHFPPPGQIRTREIMALAAFKDTLDSLMEAAKQVEPQTVMSAVRGLALLRQALGRVELRGRRSPRSGVRLMRLQDAAGLSLHTALIGGLTQRGFPIPPQGQHFIGSHERMRLGRLAQMPVWRTEDEEYSGQVIRLAWLLSMVKGGAVLSCPASGFDGKEEEPSFIFSDLARGLGLDLPPPKGGAFGGLPSLDGCRDEVGLWAALSHGLLNPGAGQAEAELARRVLAQAVEMGQGGHWSYLAERAGMERERHYLDDLPPHERVGRSSRYSGRIESPKALALLKEILQEPGMRSLSPTSLETLAACPMYWFFSRILGLAEPEAPGWEIGGREEGIWVHAALARFFAPTEYRTDWNDKQIRDRLNNCVRQARRELVEQGGMGHPSLWQAREPVITALLGKVVEQELKDLGSCTPTEVEADFGQNSGLLEVPLTEGPALRLHGRLDRLDICSSQIRVTDYKHSRNLALLKHAVDEEAQGVTAFQLPVYLAAAKARLGEGRELLARLTPTRLTSKPVGILAYADDDPFLAPLQRPGQYAPADNLFAAIAELWQRGLEGDFTPRPAKDICQYCELQGLCRAQVKVGVEEAS